MCLQGKRGTPGEPGEKVQHKSLSNKLNSMDTVAATGKVFHCFRATQVSKEIQGRRGEWDPEETWDQEEAWYAQEYHISAEDLIVESKLNFTKCLCRLRIILSSLFKFDRCDYRIYLLF